MFKTYTDITQLNADIQYLNTKTAELCPPLTAFGVAILHPVQANIGAIDISRMDILNKIKESEQTIVNAIWLNTDCVAQLDDSWTWFDATRNYRLIVDSHKILDHIIANDTLSVSMLGLLANFKNQIFRTNTQTQIYLANLNGFNGVDPNILVSTYPDTFLRIETKTT
jgi:hypothetical protein